MTAKGVPEKRKPFLGSVPFLLPVHLGFQCPEVPMSPVLRLGGSNVSGFQCPKGGKTRLC